MFTRMQNTAITMKQDGMWAKIASKHYMHVSGVEIKYDCNAWGWRVDNSKYVYGALWVAKQEAEKIAEQMNNEVVK